MSEKNWLVYIIRSDDDQLYTGITTDMVRRWREHSEGKTGARYFRGRKPKTLCLLEIHDCRSSASKREAAIKQLTRAAKNQLLAQQDDAQLTRLSEFHLRLNNPASTPKRARCVTCERPRRTCICRWITPTGNGVELVILQHPLEVHNAKNTARLLHLSLRNSELHVGEEFAPELLQAVLTRDGKTNLLLYPETAETASRGLIPTPATPDRGSLAPSQLRLVVLDGTWRKSRKLLYLNPLLQQLPRLALVDCPPSTYVIRKAQGKDELSTLEASCYALRQLDAKSVDYQPLLEAFSGFIAHQQTFVPQTRHDET